MVQFKNDVIDAESVYEITGNRIIGFWFKFETIIKGFRESSGFGPGEEYAINYDSIHTHLVKTKIHVGTLCLFQDNLLGVSNQTHCGDVEIRQNPVDSFQPIKEPLDRGKILVFREGDIIKPLCNGPGYLNDPALNIKEFFHVPLQARGDADKPDRLSCGRTVKEDDVIALLSHVAVDV